jgi:hypothetical protein
VDGYERCKQRAASTAKQWVRAVTIPVCSRWHGEDEAEKSEQRVPSKWLMFLVSGACS